MRLGWEGGGGATAAGGASGREEGDKAGVDSLKGRWHLGGGHIGSESSGDLLAG